jgi:sodium pump decarboxylase gamma subunit
MIIKGLELTLVGMTVVFGMLTLLVVIMKMSYRMLLVMNRYFPEKTGAADAVTGAGKKSEEDIAIAIAAVTAYTKGKGDI